MLPKDYRLRTDEDIKQAYKTSTKINTKHSLIYLRKTKTSFFQLLIIVSKKIFKKANKRNRIKRKIIAIFEKLKFSNRLPPYLSCIIQVKNKNIILQTQIDIENELIPKIKDEYFKLNKFNFS